MGEVRVAREVWQKNLRNFEGREGIRSATEMRAAAPHDDEVRERARGRRFIKRLFFLERYTAMLLSWRLGLRAVCFFELDE